MKRKITLLGVAVFLVTSLYSAVSWRLLRGAGAYRLGTTTGKVLSVSWRWTALAATVVGALLLLGLLIWLRKRSTVKEMRSGSDTEEQSAEKKTGKKKKDKEIEKEKKSRFGKRQPGDPEKIPPRGPSEAREGERTEPWEAVRNPDSWGMDPGPASPVEGPEDTGVTEELPFLEGKTSAGAERPAEGPDLTEPPALNPARLQKPVISPEQDPGAGQRDTPPQAPSVPMEELLQGKPEMNVPGKPALTQESPAVRPNPPGARICPVCGTSLRAKAKFCTNCGFKLEGGAP